jgi:hypothetical protein
MLQLKLFFLHLCKEFYLEGLSEELSDWTEFEYLVKKVCNRLRVKKIVTLADQLAYSAAGPMLC